MPFPAEIIEQSKEVGFSNGGFPATEPQLLDAFLSSFCEKLLSDLMGMIKMSFPLGGKENGIPDPAKLAQQTTSHAVTGGYTSIPSIRSESIVFAEFPPSHLLFNVLMPCNRIIGHGHFSRVR